MKRIMTLIAAIALFAGMAQAQGTQVRKMVISLKNGSTVKYETSKVQDVKWVLEEASKDVSNLTEAEARSIINGQWKFTKNPFEETSETFDEIFLEMANDYVRFFGHVPSDFDNEELRGKYIFYYNIEEAYTFFNQFHNMVQVNENIIFTLKSENTAEITIYNGKSTETYTLEKLETPITYGFFS